MDMVLLHKMQISPLAQSIDYITSSGGITLSPQYILNDKALSLGQVFSLTHTDGFACISCERNVKKLFNSYCYPCFKNKASADLCILKPHTCHYHLGTCREPSWGESFCFAPHYVYLSFTDKVKVGITRKTQVPFRWIDQGARYANLLCEVPSRKKAGEVEIYLTQFVKDKTHWLKMLLWKNQNYSVELLQNLKVELLSHLKETFPQYSFLEESPWITINYPIDSIDQKVKSISFEDSLLQGTLTAIKGQYIILNENKAFSVRRHEGYLCST